MFIYFFYYARHTHLLSCLNPRRRSPCDSYENAIKSEKRRKQITNGIVLFVEQRLLVAAAAASNTEEVSICAMTQRSARCLSKVKKNNRETKNTEKNHTNDVRRFGKPTVMLFLFLFLNYCVCSSQSNIKYRMPKVLSLQPATQIICVLIIRSNTHTHDRSRYMPPSNKLRLNCAMQLCTLRSEIHASSVECRIERKKKQSKRS